MKAMLVMFVQEAWESNGATRRDASTFLQAKGRVKGMKPLIVVRDTSTPYC